MTSPLFASFRSHSFDHAWDLAFYSALDRCYESSGVQVQDLARVEPTDRAHLRVAVALHAVGIADATSGQCDPPLIEAASLQDQVGHTLAVAVVGGEAAEGAAAAIESLLGAGAGFARWVSPVPDADALEKRLINWILTVIKQHALPMDGATFTERLNPDTPAEQSQPITLRPIR